MYNCIQELLYPSVCPFCGKINKDGICHTCQKKISYITEPRCMKCGKPIQNEEQEYCYDCSRFEYAFKQGYSLWVHHQPVSGAIYQYKFHNKRCFARIFAKEMVKNYGWAIRKWEIQAIIPVPLYKSKRRKRGYNQAEILADEFAKEWQTAGVGKDIIVLKNVVFRVKKTKPQKMLDDFGRQKNLQGAFSVAKGWKPIKRVLIIDDIYTTGATIQKIASQLKKAGVENVYFLTISIGQGL